MVATILLFIICLVSILIWLQIIKIHRDLLQNKFSEKQVIREVAVADLSKEQKEEIEAIMRKKTKK